MNKYKDFYDKQQAMLDKCEKQKQWQAFFEIHGLYPKSKDARILELGCANGFLMEFLRENGYNNLTGIEYDADLVEEARAKNLNVINGDALEILKSSKEKYDVIYFFDVLEHIDKDKQIEFLNEVFNHLTDEGFIGLSVPNALTPISSYFRYADFTHKCAYTKTSIEYVLVNANFPKPSIRCSHVENEKITELKQTWYELCKLEFGLKDIILTPNMFVIAYKKFVNQLRYNLNYPVFYNDYERNNKKCCQRIISLGTNCFVRSIAARYSLIPRKIDGYLSLPFDLCVTPLKSVIHFLNNDFKGFFDNLEWHKELNCWYNTKFGVLFMHDEDCKKKQELIKRYKKRIENFRSTVKKANQNNIKLTFIYHIDPLGPENNSSYVETLPFEYFVDTKENFENLNNVLEKLCKRLNFLVIDSIDSLKIPLDSNIRVIKVPIPAGEYSKNWYKEEFFASDEGLLFESAIAECIKRITEKD